MNFQRKLKLQIYDDKNKLLFNCDEQTKISFNTSESVSGAVSECNLSIVGLRPDKITFLSNYKSLLFGDFQRIKVILYGGYSNQYNCIFSGQITEAVSEFNTADYVINLKVANGYFENNEYMLLEYGNEITLKQLLNDIAGKIAWGTNYSNLLEDITLPNYSNNLPLYSHLRTLSDTTNTDIYTSNNVIYAKKRGWRLDNKKAIIYGFKNLVGTPTPTPIGCELTIRMNPNIYTGQVLRVESQRMKFLNGVDYIVSSFNHVGDTYGAEWTTHINTIIKDNIYATS
jgi:hypothetical protein